MKKTLLTLIATRPYITHDMIHDLVDQSLHELVEERQIRCDNNSYVVSTLKALKGTIIDSLHTPEYIDDIMRQYFGDSWCSIIKEGIVLNADRSIMVIFEQVDAYQFRVIAVEELHDEKSCDS